MVTAVALVAVLVGGAVVLGAVGSRQESGRRTAEPGYQDYRPPPSRATGAAAGTTGNAPQAGRDTPAPGSGQPQRRPQPVVQLGDHPINRDGLQLPAVTCELPRFGQDASSQDRFYRAGLPCLATAWTPVLDAADLPSGPVAVQTTTGAVHTPCGNQPAQRPAFYCPGNGTIYMTAEFYAARFGAHPGSYLSVLAHEYGHHVQGVSGLFDAYWEARYEAGPESPSGLELSRRLELQANCFGGMFVASTAGRGSVDPTMAGEMSSALGNGGDDARPGLPRDHGTIASNARWAELGRRHGNTARCNTWLAPADSVS